MHQAFYCSLFLRMSARRANDLTSEKPILAFLGIIFRISRIGLLFELYLVNGLRPF